MTDIQLWNGMKEGKKSCLQSIYEREFSYLCQYGIKICRDESLVEDAIQDLFVHIWQKRENLGSTDNIRSYLVVSLKRRLLRTIQSEQKSLDIEGKEDYYFEAELSFEELLISNELKVETQDLLKKAWQELSSREKEAIYLKYYENMDYDGICEVMDISYQSVRNLVFKGIKKLKDILACLLFVLFFLLNQ
jgi:RNA polymerase sigma-70 factor (ECF subfamily)